MRISVHVTPRARHTSIDRVAHDSFRIAVTAPAIYFQVPRSRVRIIRGQAARHKIVEIADETPP